MKITYSLCLIIQIYISIFYYAIFYPFTFTILQPYISTHTNIFFQVSID